MSELKVHKIGDLCFDFKMGKDVGIDFYLKSEADKVITRNKYKRCLAMARWCMDAECKTEKDADFLVRWEHRWLALAEKFKEGK